MRQFKDTPVLPKLAWVWLGLLLSALVVVPALVVRNRLAPTTEVRTEETIQAELRLHSSSWDKVERSRSFRKNEVCFDALFAGEQQSYRFEVHHAPAEDLTRVFVFETQGRWSHRCRFYFNFKGSTRVKPGGCRVKDTHERQFVEMRAALLNQVVRAAYR